MAKKTKKDEVERIGVLVVHGVGEQGRFEFLECIATNLFKVLDQDKNNHAQLQLQQGDQEARYSAQRCLRETPVLLRWQKTPGEFMELDFREVHWADLDEKMNVWRWLKLICWALGVPGVRFFKQSSRESSALPGMVLPKPLSWYQVVRARLQLFGIAMIFFLMLISIDVLYWLLTRLSFKAAWVKHMRQLIYDYLGDVKLYQDWFLRKDNDMAVVGEKSRSAIRRRMVQALTQLARDVANAKIDGYYVFAHSLGTIIAFNGLMEHSHTLPNYLTEKEWQNLPDQFKDTVRVPPLEHEMPRRPPWLAPTDAIDRAELFAGLRGLLTMGSPLSKFAALWPAIVPVNTKPLPGERPWINVADQQDIVASSITLFPGADQGNVGGLKLTNITWADQLTLVTAHTRYWMAKASKQRLINRIIPWLQGQPLVAPKNNLSPFRAVIIYWLTLGVLGFIPLFGVAYLLWLWSQVGDIMQILAQATLQKQAMSVWLANLWQVLTAIELRTLVNGMVDILFAGIFIVSVFAVIRNLWERFKFRQKPQAASVGEISPADVKAEPPWH